MSFPPIADPPGCENIFMDDYPLIFNEVKRSLARISGRN
jgi:hypothetical protein